MIFLTSVLPVGIGIIHFSEMEWCGGGEGRQGILSIRGFWVTPLSWDSGMCALDKLYNEWVKSNVSKCVCLETTMYLTQNQGCKVNWSCILETVGRLKFKMLTPESNSQWFWFICPGLEHILEFQKCSSGACFGSTYTKIEMIQRRLAWPLHKDDTQIREAFHIFSNLDAHQQTNG